MTGFRVRAVAVATATLAGLLTIAASAPPAAAAAPANDEFESRIAVASPSSTAGTTIGATEGPFEEPDLCNFNRSVWYSYTPPADGVLSLTLVSATNQTVGVYTGPLTELECSGEFPRTGEKHLSFAVEGGVEHIMAVNPADIGKPGPFTLDLVFSAPLAGAPANDSFASATTLTAPATLVPGDTTHATRQANEPVSSCGGVGGPSAWYRFRPSSNGVLHLRVGTATHNLFAAVYTGPSVGSLTELACLTDRVAVTKDVWYWIAVSGQTSTARSPFGLRAGFAAGPLNDAFANRGAISLPGVVSGTTVGASIEASEPDHQGCESASVRPGTLWFGFSPAAAGTVKVIADSNDAIGFAVYRGASLAALLPLTCSVDLWTAETVVEVQPGSHYAIAVFPASTFDTGPFGLRTEFTPGPANDMFADRVNVKLAAGRSPTVTATTDGATVEPGEPATACAAASGSVWYRFKAPGDGSVLVAVDGGAAVARVYRGTQLTSLTDEVCAESGVGGAAPVAVAAGEIYAVSVASRNPYPRPDVSLSLTYLPLLPGRPA